MSIENMIRVYSSPKRYNCVDLLLGGISPERPRRELCSANDTRPRWHPSQAESFVLFHPSVYRFIFVHFNEVVVKNFLTETNLMALCGGKQLLAYKTPTHIYAQRKTVDDNTGRNTAEVWIWRIIGNGPIRWGVAMTSCYRRSQWRLSGMRKGSLQMVFCS